MCTGGANVTAGSYYPQERGRLWENSSTFLTLVSLFIGFPKSHSTWEPLVFAWHLICKQSKQMTVRGAKQLQASAVYRPDLRWDSGACVGQSGWERDHDLGSMSIVSILKGLEGVRGHVGNGHLQHHQSLVRQRQHLHTIFISGSGQMRKQLSVVHNCVRVCGSKLPPSSARN